MSFMARVLLVIPVDTAHNHCCFIALRHQRKAKAKHKVAQRLTNNKFWKHINPNWLAIENNPLFTTSALLEEITAKEIIKSCEATANVALITPSKLSWTLKWLKSIHRRELLQNALIILISCFIIFNFPLFLLHNEAQNWKRLKVEGDTSKRYEMGKVYFYVFLCSSS